MERRPVSFMSKTLLSIIVLLLIVIVRLLLLVEAIYDVVEPKVSIVAELSFARARCELYVQPGEVCVFDFHRQKEVGDDSSPKL